MTISLGPSNDSIPRGEWARARNIADEEAKRQRAVARRNRKLASSSPAERRVIIAKDVLKWLDTRKLVAHAGSYLGIGPAGYAANRNISDIAGKNLLAVPSPVVNGHQCVACALGGIFAVAVERKDVACDLTSLWDHTAFSQASLMRSALSSFFDWQQLVLIETAFERGWGFLPSDVRRHHEWPILAGRVPTGPYDTDAAHDSVLHAARGFGSDYNNDEARMRAIMGNIIANGGTFVP